MRSRKELNEIYESNCKLICALDAGESIVIADKTITRDGNFFFCIKIGTCRHCNQKISDILNIILDSYR